MKNWWIILIIVIILAAVGYGGWFYFIKKSPESGSCKATSKCESGLNCIANVCSSGNAGSVCVVKADCKTDYCVSGKCTTGKISDACATYKDCQNGLYCQKSICSTPPSYTKYFDKISISKIKMGMPPGPTNIPVATTEFSLANDAIEIDITNNKKTSGKFYTEVLDPITGETIFTTEKQTISDSAGTGFGLPTNTAAGEYELNIYFNNELIYNVPITVKN